MLRGILGDQGRIITRSWLGIIGLSALVFFLAVAAIGGFFAPYDPWDNLHSAATGKLAINLPPSHEFLFGTTNLGRDVFSQMLAASGNTVIISLTAGLISSVIGVNIGLISGFFRGRIDSFLMRLTDVAFGVPFLPFVIVLIALFGHSIWFVVLAIAVVLWRNLARVVRALVLLLREQQFVLAARARGCSNARIMYRHILPNLLPLVILYTAFNIAWSVIAEAGTSFLGFGDPDHLTWGSMMYDLWSSGMIRTSWWWFAPPTVCIVLLPSALIFLSRAYEEVANPRLIGR